jgi:S-DNA-T family DNA segregation ATPase FtsK/SpoIIIE
MSVYKTYSPQEVDTLLSNFLISSWSYSKVSSFARNEKAFEMGSIYGIRSKTSATTMAGNAYHEALRVFFLEYKDGKTLDIVTLEKIAFEYLDERPANFWKIQKTTPTVEECKNKATEVVTKLLRNFFSEIKTYLDDIKEIIDVEIYCNEWLSINGVDIPLPCHGVIDLVYLSVSGEIVILDHKSKVAYTDQQEAQLSIGEQAITYVNIYEAKSGLEINRLVFMENKPSQNKDKSSQLVPIKVTITKDTRRLYEALLYEPLKRMIEAVSDPDYTYLINQADNYVEKAELYEFWMKTMIAEVEDFDVPIHKRELISKRLKKIRDASLATVNPKVIREFQKNAAEFIQYDLSNKDMTKKEKIEHILRTFGIIINVAHVFNGISSNTYLLEVSAGVKITSIHSHVLDIANALDVSAVRISKDLVVHKGKSYVSVEFSKEREGNLPFEPTDLVGCKIPLGKDNFNNTIVWDLENHSTPHMLICGATGSGKSVFIKSTMEYAKLAGVDRIIVMDPKYEFSKLKVSGIEVYQEIIEIENEMANLVEYMNDLVKKGKKAKTLVIFDEFADALLMSRKGKDLEIREMVQVGNFAPKKDSLGMLQDGGAKMALQKTGELKSLDENLQALVQKGRSLGFRVMAATQRADVKVITGNIKVNFPVVVCFYVPKAVDSMVMLDEPGAENLTGSGDGLIKSPQYRQITRFQAYYKA